MRSNFSPRVEQALRCATDILRSSRRTVVLTGAGISTPSGIPDFRSTQDGLWARYDPFQVASLTVFRYDPNKFFDWLRPLAKGIFSALPNAAHIGLSRLQQAGHIHTIVTQNIDCLHQRSGSTDVLEVHGTFETLTCVRCYHKQDAAGYMRPYLEAGTIPHCPHCDGVLKPDVVLFGEQLPQLVWLKVIQECQKCDLMIVAGSSLEVMPVAGLPVRALEAGAHLIIINQMPTYIDVRADVVLNEDLVDVIPYLVNEVLGE